MEKLLTVARQAVTSAAQICVQVQQQLVSEDTLIKKDRSPVTVADFASQAVVSRVLHEAFPHIPLVGEESAAALKQDDQKPVLQKINRFLADWREEEILQAIDLGAAQPTDRFWTLDPIDGTKGFLRGDQYAIALALIEEGEPVLGVLACPNLACDSGLDKGVLAYAVKGQGAYIQPLSGGKAQRIHVSNRDSQGAVRFLESVESGHANMEVQEKIRAHFGPQAQIVRYDSQVKYAVLARGEADVYLRLPNPKTPDYREKIWDHAAGVVIVEQAGGKVSDVFGRALDFSRGRKLTENQGVIVTNNILHEAVIEQTRAHYEG